LANGARHQDPDRDEGIAPTPRATHGQLAPARERDALTVLKLLYFQEQIFVYVADGELKTEHSFSLAQRFLTLHYEIERISPA
jgi:hypothetical protein